MCKHHKRFVIIPPFSTCSFDIFIRFALSNDLDPVDLLVVGTLYLFFFFFSIFSSIFIEVRDLS